jgi:hypothetical protein
MLSVIFVRRTLAILIGFLLLSDAARAEDEYIFMHLQTPINQNNNGSTIMLQAALEATKSTYGPYKLSVAPVMQRSRMLQEMQDGKLVNVNVASTTREWEQTLIPIRIPVDKGLSSYRIALIDNRRQDEFNRITSLPQLQQVAIGVGTQWPTRALYERAGLHVVPGTSQAGLYDMLMAGRFDYYPRTVDEAILGQAEQASHYPHIAIEKSLILYAPLPRYFFVSPKTPRLAERLRAGLEKLIESGEFDRLFNQYYGPMIAKTHFCTRTIIKVSNPDLSPETPLRRTKLWFDPANAAGKEPACQSARR